jgi:hypothetical protein
MEYNCHFVSTSNQAGPLELAEYVVDQLKSVYILYSLSKFFIAWLISVQMIPVNCPLLDVWRLMQV